MRADLVLLHKKNKQTKKKNRIYDENASDKYQMVFNLVLTTGFDGPIEPNGRSTFGTFG